MNIDINMDGPYIKLTKYPFGRISIQIQNVLLVTRYEVKCTKGCWISGLAGYYIYCPVVYIAQASDQIPVNQTGRILCSFIIR